MGKGRGWFGDSKRHALAAQGIPTKLSKMPLLDIAPAADMRRANQVLEALYRTEESADEHIEARIHDAIMWMEEVALGPKHTGILTSTSELKDNYARVDSLLTKAVSLESNVDRKKQLRDVRTAARIARSQL